ncbi:hypothetical protein HHL26_19570 [Sphingobium sp. TB-6]|uniref:hypothetical protein n=1 Tax=Sphingobium sp. TB-6 TaxID=2728850 RepID=UPI00146DD5D2|nr:hypothetical protein [Sphingobium sp. TB-6]NML91242.1 hypothetical protein [Sphingobium sp. TB-6]
MPKQRHAIAQSLAQRLFAAEEAVDLAAARMAELHAALPLARLDARVAAAVGQATIDSSAAAQVLIARTRAQVIEIHGSLKQVSDDIGLGETSYGDLLKVAVANPTPVENRLRAV